MNAFGLQDFSIGFEKKDALDLQALSIKFENLPSHGVNIAWKELAIYCQGPAAFETLCSVMKQVGPFEFYLLLNGKSVIDPFNISGPTEYTMGLCSSTGYSMEFLQTIYLTISP